MGDGDRSSEPQSPDWYFLVDENLDPSIVEVLTEHGIVAEYVPDVLFAGVDDAEDILPYCRETGSVLVTNNVRDFNAAGLSPADHPGIVIVHDKDRPAHAIAAELRRLVEAYSSRDAFEGFESADDWATDA